MSFATRLSAAWRGLTSSTPAPVGAERRSLEDPAFPVSAALLDSLAGWGPTRSGVQINEHTAMTVVAIFAAHKVIGETMGMLPWCVYAGDEDDKTRKRAKDHPAYNMLRRSPNPEMTAFTFRETASHHCMGWGNHYARIIFDNAHRARQLWPLRPGEVTPERKGGRLVYNVRGAAAESAGRSYLDCEEVFHVPLLGYDGLKGYSPIMMGREAIGAGKAAELFAAAFWGNGTRLSGHLEHPGRLKPETATSLSESWAAKYSGVGNAHKSPVLEEGMKWVKESCAPEEAQFIETRQFSVTDIARLYRIPPHMLGDQSRATHSNIEQASLEFLIYTMSPWFAKFEAEADRKLLGDSGEYFVKFDERQLLRTDMEGRSDYITMMRQWGMFSANDALRFEGENTIGTQGDVYLSPINMQNAKIAEKQTEPPPAPTGGSPKGSGGAPGNSPFGGKDANRGVDFAARTTRAVFEDAMLRMLRKEMNAQGNGKATDHFYAEHRKHVAEALTPALNALCGLLIESGVIVDVRDAVSVIEDVAAERHPNLNGNAGDIATQTAAAIIEAVGKKAA